MKFDLRTPRDVKDFLEVIHKLDYRSGQRWQVTIEPYREQHNRLQQKLMWAVTRDISEQIWPEGVQYKANIWHHYLKREYLPDDTQENIGELTMPGYRKWQYDDDREVLNGSTTQLTVKGMAEYTEQLIKFATENGVKFQHYKFSK
jgi:hypothetical protein